jgi:hypothetical protein
MRLFARWKEMASPIVGREGLEESIDAQVEAVPLWGSRSFGAKNNAPLEVLVFTGVFERPLPAWV